MTLRATLLSNAYKLTIAAVALLEGLRRGHLAMRRIQRVLVGLRM